MRGEAVEKTMMIFFLSPLCKQHANYRILRLFSFKGDERWSGTRRWIS